MKLLRHIAAKTFVLKLEISQPRIERVAQCKVWIAHLLPLKGRRFICLLKIILVLTVKCPIPEKVADPPRSDNIPRGNPCPWTQPEWSHQNPVSIQAKEKWQRITAGSDTCTLCRLPPARTWTLRKCIWAAGWTAQINPATCSYFYSKASSSTDCRYPLKCNIRNVKFSLFNSHIYLQSCINDLVISIYHISQHFKLVLPKMHLLQVLKWVSPRGVTQKSFMSATSIYWHGGKVSQK